MSGEKDEEPIFVDRQFWQEVLLAVLSPAVEAVVSAVKEHRQREHEHLLEIRKGLFENYKGCAEKG